MTGHVDRPISRRALLRGGGALTAAMLLSACGGGGKSKGTGGGIRVLASGGRWVKGQYMWRVVDEFNKAHPDSKIEIISAGQKFKELFSSLASAGNLPDIVFSPALDLATVLQEKWALSLDGDLGLDIEHRLPDTMWVDGITTSNGHIYSFAPDDARGFYLQYNTSMMKQAGLDPTKPPRTWTELIEMSKQITAKVTGVSGLAMPLKVLGGYRSLTITYSWAHPTVPLGAQGVIEGFDYRTGRYAHDVRHIEAIEMLLKLHDAKVLHPDSATLDAAGSDAYFNTGRVAFSLTGPWAAQVNQRRKFTDWAITNLPTADAGTTPLQHGTLATAAYFAMRTTKNMDLVKQAMDLFSSEQVIKRGVAEDAAAAPDPEVTLDNAPVPQLKTIAEIQKTVTTPPVPASRDPKALEVQKAEKKLPPPRTDWWQICQGALAGKAPNWKADLAAFNDEMNKRFDQALKKAGADRSLFTFADWSGTVNYPVKTSIGG